MSVSDRREKRLSEIRERVRLVRPSFGPRQFNPLEYLDAERALETHARLDVPFLLDELEKAESEHRFCVSAGERMAVLIEMATTAKLRALAEKLEAESHRDNSTVLAELARRILAATEPKKQDA